MQPTSLMLVFFVAFSIILVMAGKIDPWSEEAFWETIKHTKTIREVSLDDDNAVNSRPSVPYLKVVCISDTHDRLADLMKDIPDGDVLIHSGDFTNAGGTDQLKEFNDLMGRLPHRHKLVVAGNHELGFDDHENMTLREPTWADSPGTPHGYEMLTNVTYLQDRTEVIDGINFYGASWHPLQGYPFSERRDGNLRVVWKRVPTETDVLITHTPPLGYLDKFGDERWGCRNLLEEVETRIQPEYHIFGHVHECYGAVNNDKTVFINAAQCDKQNRINNKPIVFYIPKK